MSYPERQIISDDWKRNWQQSIAVRISAIVMWVVVPLVFVAALFLMYDLEQDLEKRLEDQVEVILHRVWTRMSVLPEPPLKELEPILHSELDELGVRALDINFRDQHLEVGVPDVGDEVVTRIVNPAGHGGMRQGEDGQLLTMQVYHAPVRLLAREKRTRTLLILVTTMTIFGVFLVWAIRTIVHKPLRELVSATRAVSFGDTSIRLKAVGSDEFSYISRFFNEMMQELEENHRALERVALDARQASRAKSVFLANMSHELRTPLNAIIGYAEMLEEDLRDARMDQDVVDVIKVQDAARHLLEIINNILDISKIEAGKVDVYVEEFPLDAVLEDVATTMAPIVGKRDNELIRVWDAGKLGIVRSDQTKIRQLLFNLLSNATKFTENGRISLRAERLEHDGVEVMRFVVSDTGIGISPDQMGLLFQAFSQADISTTRKYGGTGLGLVICKYYCELLGGTIKLDSDLGHGTEFTVTLPTEIQGAESGSGHEEPLSAVQ